jgi:hypothetical protein
MKKLIYSISLLLLLSSCTPTYIVTFSGSTGGSVSEIGGEYDEGATVSVSAQPETGYEFIGWSDGSSQNPRTISVSENLNLTALFGKQQFSVSVNTQGEGTVTTSGAVAEGSFEYGSSARFEAVPAEGWYFDSWTGDATGNNNPINISVDGPKSITAVFKRKQFDLTVTVEGEGTVTEQVIVQPGQYDYETQVKLTATAEEGWAFSGWMGDVASTENPVTVTITEVREVTATFIRKKYELNITIEGEGTVKEEVIVQPGQYDYETVVRLTAIPSDGWKFVRWSGDVESEELVIEVPIEKGTSLGALFIKDSLAISIDIRGNGKINSSIENYQIVLDLGESISLQAESTDDHSIFLGWSGDLITSENPLIIAPESNLNLIANFLDKESIQNIGITGEGEIVFDSYIYNDSNNEEIIGFEVRALPNPGYSFRGWNGISTLFYGGVEVSKNPIEIDLTQRLSNGPLDAFFVPEDGNYEEIKTLFQILKYPFDKDGVNEILEGTGGAAAGAAFYENETGKYIIFMPNYPNNYVSSKDGLPRMGATIYRLEEDGWRFFKLDEGMQSWSIRNTEVVDNKYIISGDGNEIGESRDWSGDLFFGEIIGEDINWTRVTNDEQMSYFHGVAAGDLNGDGLIDLGGTGSNGYRVFIQSSPGVFELFENVLNYDEEEWNSIGGRPFAWDFADLDNDGVDEIIMADYGGEFSYPKANNISVWKYNTSKSSFEIDFIGVIPRSTHSLKRGGTKVSGEDFNNDGMKDILVVGEGDNITLEVWLNKGDSTFDLQWFYGWDGADFLIREYFLADANDDGYLDILPNTQNIGSRIILEGGYPYAKRYYNPQILLNQGDGTFKEYSEKSIIDYYSSFGGFSIPYANNGLLEIMSIMVSEDKVYPEKNEVYVKTEVISIDLK